MKIYAARREIDIEDYVGQDIWFKCWINGWNYYCKIIAVDNDFVTMYVIRREAFNYFYKHYPNVEDRIRSFSSHKSEYTNTYYRTDCERQFIQAIATKNFYSTSELFSGDVAL